MREWRWIGVGIAVAIGSAARAAPGVAASGRYVCSDGSLANIDMAQGGPVLRRGGKAIRLAPGAAFWGFRYLADGLELRGKGDVGHRTLAIRARGAPPLDCKSVPPVATPGVATGTIVQAARAALPAGVVVRVELRDTARADAAAPLLARTELRPRGNQPPLHWRLDYDAGKTVHPARPSLSARISDANGKLLWISDTFTPVPVTVGGSHAEAEIRVKPVQR